MIKVDVCNEFFKLHEVIIALYLYQLVIVLDFITEVIYNRIKAIFYFLFEIKVSF